MKHHYTDTDKRKSFPPSWSVTDNGFGRVVLRLHDGADEAVMELTPKQAREIAEEILLCASQTETARHIEPMAMPPDDETPFQP